MPAWSASLPDFCKLNDLRVAPVSNSLAIDVEVGEPMTRRRFTGDMEDLQGTFLMITRTHAIALKDFWRTTLKDGSLTFTAKHPMTLVDNTEFIFLSVPSASRVGHLYNVSITVRKMP